MFASVCDIRSVEESIRTKTNQRSLPLESHVSQGQSFTVINKKGKTKVLILQFSSILKLPL